MMKNLLWKHREFLPLKYVHLEQFVEQFWTILSTQTVQRSVTFWIQSVGYWWLRMDGGEWCDLSIGPSWHDDNTCAKLVFFLIHLALESSQLQQLFKKKSWYLKYTLGTHTLQQFVLV